MIQKLSEIHYLTDRRHCSWGDFYKIQLSFTSYFERFFDSYNANLFFILVNEADSARPNAVIESVELGNKEWVKNRKLIRS